MWLSRGIKPMAHRFATMQQLQHEALIRSESFSGANAIATSGEVHMNHYYCGSCLTSYATPRYHSSLCLLFSSHPHPHPLHPHPLQRGPPHNSPPRSVCRMSAFSTPCRNISNLTATIKIIPKRGKFGTCRLVGNKAHGIDCRKMDQATER